MRSKTDQTKKQEGKPPRVWPILLSAILLLLGGAGVFFYPTLSNYLAERHQMTVIQNYIDNVNEIDTTQMEEEWAKAVQYNENLAGDPVHDPFVPGSGYALPGNYLDVLNVSNDGTMGYIEIPKISVNLPIFHGSDEEVLERGAGHIEQTFLPIGSNGGHAVITGHRGLPQAELFTRLDELELGDKFLIHVLDATLAYEIDQITVVEPDELSQIRPVPGEDLVTLVTCTPYGVNTHRMLVRGHRTEYVAEEQIAMDSGVHVVIHGINEDMRNLGVALGLGILMLILLLGLLSGRGRRKTDGTKTCE